MNRSTLGALLALTAAVAVAPALILPAQAEDEHHFEYERQKWSFAGMSGAYDKAQLQRGFQVYQQVCSNCHSLSRIYWRNLVESGGPEFPEAAVKQLAAKWPNRPLEESDSGETVASKDGKTSDGLTVKKGELLTRAPLLSDPILGPYRNVKEAKAAQNGALPPNLSVIAKARDIHNEGFWVIHIGKMAADVFNGYQEGGPDYIYNLLLNYREHVPAYKRDANGKLVAVEERAVTDEKAVERCVTIATEPGKPDKCNALNEGLNYNVAFPGNQIAMVPPISKENFVSYQDGTGSLEENARDVAAFLEWAADPKLNQRKAMGWQVMLYLLITSVLLYVGKQRIWANVKH